MSKKRSDVIETKQDAVHEVVGEADGGLIHVALNAADVEVLTSALVVVKSLGKRGLATKIARLKDKMLAAVAK